VHAALERPRVHALRPYDAHGDSVIAPFQGGGMDPMDGRMPSSRMVFPEAGWHTVRPGRH
jgi:hypothetical protein